MHRQWRRQTVSKNAILIDGRGQYADEDKARSKASSGKLVEVTETGDIIKMTGDASAAYKLMTPAVERVLRDIHLVGDRYLVVVDRVDLSDALPIQWRLHAEHRIEVGGETFRLTGKRAGLYGHMVLSTAGAPVLRAVEGFPGIGRDEIKDLPKHWHVEAAIPAARHHVLITLLVPYALDDRRRVLHYIDDQGYDIHAHFVEADGREHTVSIEKRL
jgi:Heparinase II/III-like protein